jgi:hypothetical protein
MATERWSAQGQPPDGDKAPIRVYSCGRVGMQANPPRPRLGRFLRRRVSGG